MTLAAAHMFVRAEGQLISLSLTTYRVYKSTVSYYWVILRIQCVLQLEVICD